MGLAQLAHEVGVICREKPDGPARPLVIQDLRAHRLAVAALDARRVRASPRDRSPAPSRICVRFPLPCSWRAPCSGAASLSQQTPAATRTMCPIVVGGVLGQVRWARNGAEFSFLRWTRRRRGRGCVLRGAPSPQERGISSPQARAAASGSGDSSSGSGWRRRPRCGEPHRVRNGRTGRAGRSIAAVRTPRRRSARRHAGASAGS